VPELTSGPYFATKAFLSWFLVQALPNRCCEASDGLVVAAQGCPEIGIMATGRSRDLLAVDDTQATGNQEKKSGALHLFRASAKGPFRSPELTV